MPPAIHLLLAACISLARATFAASSAPTSSFCDAQPGWMLDWQDEFDGVSLNTSSWSALDLLTWDIGCCRDAACLADNVQVSGGALHLLSDQRVVKGHNFTTAAINTKGKRSWTASAASSFRVCVSAVLPGELHGRLFFIAAVTPRPLTLALTLALMQRRCSAGHMAGSLDDA